MSKSEIELVRTPPRPDAFINATPEALVENYEALFQRINLVEPTLRCFASGSPDKARVMARVAALADRYPEAHGRPPLFGVPVGVKDIFRMDDEPIQCGSLLPADAFGGTQADCVTALKNAGAIILGKTCTAEFAYFEPGPTANPHDPGRTPGGSSSGSACGVAAGLFPFAVGTQTIGSIIRPAAYCGVVGFKPTAGRVSTDGLVWFSPSMDQVGFFCSRPQDLDLLMAAAYSPWKAAPRPSGSIRLGLPAGPFLEQAPRDSLARFMDDLNALVAKSGRTGRDISLAVIPCLENIEAISSLHSDMIAAEAALEHKGHGWLDRFGHMYRPRSAAIMEKGSRIPQERIQEGRASGFELRDALLCLMVEYGIDAWAAPSAMGEADQGLSSTGAPAMSLPWTHAGLPAITLPRGTGANGLPLGLQLVGKPGEDERLVAIATSLTQS